MIAGEVDESTEENTFVAKRPPADLGSRKMTPAAKQLPNRVRVYNRVYTAAENRSDSTCDIRVCDRQRKTDSAISDVTIVTIGIAYRIDVVIIDVTYRTLVLL